MISTIFFEKEFLFHQQIRKSYSHFCKIWSNEIWFQLCSSKEYFSSIGLELNLKQLLTEYGAQNSFCSCWFYASPCGWFSPSRTVEVRLDHQILQWFFLRLKDSVKLHICLARLATNLLPHKILWSAWWKLIKNQFTTALFGVVGWDVTVPVFLNWNFWAIDILNSGAISCCCTNL